MNDQARRNWIGVVSREHVRIGVKAGFAMLNHGKLGPLIQMNPGDWLVYYSPKTSYPTGATLKAFTAIGTVKDSEPYQEEMLSGTMGFRRDIDWLEARDTPLTELSDALDFTRGSWGMLARRGLFEITTSDLEIIRDAMTKMTDKKD